MFWKNDPFEKEWKTLLAFMLKFIFGCIGAAIAISIIVHIIVKAVTQ
jgi:hypothetical protein